jgi:3-oxoacyl-[acyl-carrier protein] reductase
MNPIYEMQNTPLTGKVAFVTGGAGGLGSAICHALALAGASVIVGYNNSAASANMLVDTLFKCVSNHHIAIAAPVTDSAALAKVAATIEAQFGRLDILVNCAGTTKFVAHPDLNALDDDLIDAIFATNVRGAIACVRAMQPMLKRHSAGLVVNISSIAAQTAMGSNIAYCASKAALDNLTKSLARALAPEIRIVSVAPGLVDTEFVQKMDVTWRNTQAEKSPLGRLATPDEIALAVLATATHFKFSTGTIFAVDGGRPLL